MPGSIVLWLTLQSTGSSSDLTVPRGTAIVHCAKGIDIWTRASNDEGVEPDVVTASCGDVATKEALAATAILRERLPDLKVRFVNVVDLFKL